MKRRCKCLIAWGSGIDHRLSTDDCPIHESDREGRWVAARLAELIELRRGQA